MHGLAYLDDVAAAGPQKILNMPSGMLGRVVTDAERAASRFKARASSDEAQADAYTMLAIIAERLEGPEATIPHFEQTVALGNDKQCAFEAAQHAFAADPSTHIRGLLCARSNWALSGGTIPLRRHPFEPLWRAFSRVCGAWTHVMHVSRKAEAHDNLARTYAALKDGAKHAQHTALAREVRERIAAAEEAERKKKAEEASKEQAASQLEDGEQMADETPDVSAAGETDAA